MAKYITHITINGMPPRSVVELEESGQVEDLVREGKLTRVEEPAEEPAKKTRASKKAADVDA